MSFSEMIQDPMVWDTIRVAIAAVACFIAYFVVRFVIQRSTRMLSSRVALDDLQVLDFFLLYAVYALVVGIILNLAGFNVTALLGAAGVFGVAIGFASQTTISNVISGIFLMLEHSLRVGDTIRFSDIQGRIQEFGLLSVSLKTIDNKLIRVPNELLLKNNVTNLTALKDRVVVFNASLYAKDDIEKAQKVFQTAWEQMKLAIKDKDVSISYAAASADMVGFSINIWVKASNIIAAKSEYVRLTMEEARKQELPLYIAPKA